MEEVKLSKVAKWVKERPEGEDFDEGNFHITINGDLGIARYYPIEGTKDVVYLTEEMVIELYKYIHKNYIYKEPI